MRLWVGSTLCWLNTVEQTDISKWVLLFRFHQSAWLCDFVYTTEINCLYYCFADAATIFKHHSMEKCWTLGSMKYMFFFFVCFLFIRFYNFMRISLFSSLSFQYLQNTQKISDYWLMKWMWFNAIWMKWLSADLFYLLHDKQCLLNTSDVQNSCIQNAEMVCFHFQNAALQFRQSHIQIALKLLAITLKTF